MREIDVARLWLDAAYAAVFGQKQLEEVAGNQERMKQFLSLHREDAELKYIERMVDCTTAPLTFYHEKREPDLKVVRHDNLGIVPWTSLRIRFWYPDPDQIPRDDFDLDEEHLMPKFLVGKKVANVNVREYMLRYPHLISRENRDVLRSHTVIFWGTVYGHEEPYRKWAPGLSRLCGAEAVTSYGTHANGLISHRDQAVAVIDE